MSATQKVTKQSHTKQQVLELIERLGVGTALPSERQLSADLGVSRLTVRAPLDDLVARAQGAAELRRRILADPEAAVAAEGVEPSSALLAELRERLSHR